MEIVENKMLKWNGHALPKRILTFSPEGTKRGGRSEMELEREARRVMKQKNLTPGDTVNWGEAKIDGQPVTSVTPGHCYRQKMDIKVSNKCHIYLRYKWNQNLPL